MIKSLVNSILVLVLYFAIYFGFEKLFKLLFLRKEFTNVNPDYFLFIGSIFNLFFIGILLWIIRKKAPFNRKNTNIKIKYLVIVSFLAITFFVIKEPFLRIDLILGEIEIPEFINERYRSNIDLIASFLNIVILTSVFEELLFRKTLLSLFKENDLLIGIVSSSLLFTCIHIDYNQINLFALIALFFFGFIACILYKRFGFIYNLLFHITSNIIWFWVDLNRIKYWELLRILDFGLFYWIIIVISFFIILYLVIVIFNQLNILNKVNNKSVNIHE